MLRNAYLQSLAVTAMICVALGATVFLTKLVG